MFGIIKSQFRDKRNSLLIFLGTSLAFSELYLALYPTIRAQSAQLSQLLKLYPESFFKAFGLDAATLTFSRVEYFLSSEIFSLIWPILVIIFAIQLGNYAFVAEIEDGTVELTLSQPISRLRLFISRYFGGLLLLATFTFVSILGIIPLIELHGFEYSLHNFLLIALIGFLLGWAIYGISIFFSVVFSQKAFASFATAGIMIVMYVINIISGLKESLVNIQYVSFFHYFVGGTILAKGIVVKYTYPVLLLTVLVLFALSAFWFVQRDIAA